MPLTVEQISIIRSNAYAALADATANPKRDYSIDGQTVKNSEFVERQLKLIAWCDTQERVAAPFIIDSQLS